MIFLAGPHGAGKTTSSDFLVSFGFEKIDLGPTIRRLHEESGSPLPLRDWCARGEAEHGPEFTDHILATEMNRMLDAWSEESPPFLDLLVVGSRSLDGINYLKEHVRHLSGFHDVIIYLNASEETLRRNYNLREKTEYTPDKFAAILQRDLDMGLGTVRNVADYLIRNEGSIEVLEAALHALIFGTLSCRRK